MIPTFRSAQAFATAFAFLAVPVMAQAATYTLDAHAESHAWGSLFVDVRDGDRSQLSLTGETSIHVGSAGGLSGRDSDEAEHIITLSNLSDQSLDLSILLSVSAWAELFLAYAPDPSETKRTELRAYMDSISGISVRTIDDGTGQSGSRPAVISMGSYALVGLTRPCQAWGCEPSSQYDDGDVFWEEFLTLAPGASHNLLFSGSSSTSTSVHVATVPLPAAGLTLGAALAGLVLSRRRKNS